MKVIIMIEALKKEEEFEQASQYPTYLVKFKDKKEEVIFYSTFNEREAEEEAVKNKKITRKDLITDAKYLIKRYFEMGEISKIKYINLEELNKLRDKQ